MRLPDRDALVPELADIDLVADDEQTVEEFYAAVLAALRELADDAAPASHGRGRAAALLPEPGREDEWQLSVRARVAAFDYDRATRDVLAYDAPDLPEQKRDQVLDRHDSRLSKFARLAELQSGLAESHRKVEESRRALDAAAAAPEDEKKEVVLAGAQARLVAAEEAVPLRVERLRGAVVQAEGIAAAQHALAATAAESRHARRNAEAEARIAAISGPSES